MSCFTKCGKWENFRHQLCILMVHQPPKRPWKMLLEAGNRINTGAGRYFYLRQNLESAGGLKEGARQGLWKDGSSSLRVIRISNRFVKGKQSKLQSFVLNLAQMIPLGFFQIFIIIEINNIWVYLHTLPILLNQGAIFELKAHTPKNANPTFQRHLPLGMGSIFVPVTVLHSSNCHTLLRNPQYAPLASVFLDYCSLCSAFCVPLDMGQILTWAAESHTVWILHMSQRNLPFSIPLYLSQHLAESSSFLSQTRGRKPPETHQRAEKQLLSRSKQFL